MFTVGNVISIRIACVNCGQLTHIDQRPNSDFYIQYCWRKECDMYGVRALIEKKTHLVINVEPFYWEGTTQKRLYPVLMDEDGNLASNVKTEIRGAKSSSAPTDDNRKR